MSAILLFHRTDGGLRLTVYRDSARAQRGEISKREGNPNQALKTGKGDKGGGSKMMEQDGLKLRLELNLDVEIELKARIQGDLTIALL